MSRSSRKEEREAPDRDLRHPYTKLPPPRLKQTLHRLKQTLPRPLMQPHAHTVMCTSSSGPSRSGHTHNRKGTHGSRMKTSGVNRNLVSKTSSRSSNKPSSMLCSKPSNKPSNTLCSKPSIKPNSRSNTLYSKPYNVPSSRTQPQPLAMIFPEPSGARDSTRIKPGSAAKPSYKKQPQVLHTLNPTNQQEWLEQVKLKKPPGGEDGAVVEGGARDLDLGAWSASRDGWRG